MEVDKVADEVTDMEVDKVTDMKMRIEEIIFIAVNILLTKKETCLPFSGELSK